MTTFEQHAQRPKSLVLAGQTAPIRLIRNPDFANEHVRTNFAVWLRLLRPAGLSDTVIIERLQRLMVLWLEGYQAPEAAKTLKEEGL